MGAREMDDVFALRLRALMAERGLGVLALARRVPCDKAQVSRVANGKQRPTATLAGRLDEALGAGGELAALAAAHDGGAGDEYVAWARRHPRRVDEGVIVSLESVLAAQRRIEDSLGVAAVLGPVKEHLAVIGELVKQARGPLRPRLVQVAGQWAQYGGWLCLSAGQKAAGDALLSQALQFAVEAGGPDLLSEVLCFQGYSAWVDRRAAVTVGLGQAAQRDPATFPLQLARAAALEAHGHAASGGQHEVETLLDRADALAAGCWDRQEEAPPWLYFQSPGFFTLLRGVAYRLLGTDPAYRRKAITALTGGYALLPAGEQQSEWAAEYLIQVAMVHVQDGNADEAAATALDVAKIAMRTGSVGLVKMLAPLRASLAARYPGHPSVTELTDALR